MKPQPSPSHYRQALIARHRHLCLLLLAGVAAFLPGILLAEEVSGSVNAVWTRGNHPDYDYVVVGDITVLEGDSLVIEPGTRVFVRGNWSIAISGLFKCNGQDNRRVKIWNDTQWRGIYFTAESSPLSTIIYADIINPWIGIQTIGGYMQIRRSRIDAINTGIHCISSNPDISNNEVIRATGNNTLNEVKAISLSNGSGPQIINNALIEAVGGNSNAYGIWIDESSPIIKSNWIDVYSDASAVGIYSYRTAKAVIIRNTIRINSSVMMRGLWTTYSTGVEFSSNTMLLMTTCTNAISIFVDVSSILNFFNNILVGNGFSTGDSVVGEIDAEYSGYNCYWNHDTNHRGHWEGNEDVLADPLFESEGIEPNAGYYRLAWPNFDPAHPERTEGRSPCIDAGHPLVDDSPYGDQHQTRSDIGRYPFNYDPNPNNVAAGIERPYSHDLIAAFPNPFNRSTTLNFELALPGRASVSVIDMNGRSVAALWNGPLGAGSHRIDWSGDGLAAGEYLVRFDLPGETRISRVIYLP